MDRYFDAIDRFSSNMTILVIRFRWLVLMAAVLITVAIGSGMSRLEFAANYTSLLVSLHNVFNGQPDTLMSTLMQMYQLKSMAQQLMDTDDPRLPNSTLGIGPPWQYVPNASHFHKRGGRAYPLA